MTATRQAKSPKETLAEFSGFPINADRLMIGINLDGLYLVSRHRDTICLYHQAVSAKRPSPVYPTARQ